MSKKTFWLLYTLILILAFGLRFWALGRIPNGTYWDETAMLVEAKKVLTTGTDLHGLSPWHLIYPSYGDYKLAPYIWSTVISARIFGINAFALRLPSALAGLATIAVAGLLARSLFFYSQTTLKKKQQVIKNAQIFQLATMLVVTTAPWSIMFSRTGFEGHLGQMLLALAALCLVYAWSSPLEKSRPAVLLLLASGLIGGLAGWTYFSVRFVWPGVFLLLTAYLWWHTRRYHFCLLSGVLVGIIFSLMFFLMQATPFYAESNAFRFGTDSILNDPELPHLVNYNRAAGGNTVLAALFFSQKGTQLSKLLTNYTTYFQPAFLFLTGDANLRHSTTTSGLFLLPFAPFLLWGLVALARQQPTLFLFLFGWWLLGLLPASVPTQNLPHALRSLNSLVPLCLLIAYGLTQLFSLKKNLRLGLTIMTVVFVGLAGTHFGWFYFNVYPTLAASDWQADSWRHGQILATERSHYQAIYTLNLDHLTYLWYLLQPEVDLSQLPTSQQFQFSHLDNIYFNTTPDPNTTNYFVLGNRKEVENWQRQQQLTGVTHYDYQTTNHNYVGVAF